MNEARTLLLKQQHDLTEDILSLFTSFQLACSTQLEGNEDIDGYVYEDVKFHYDYWETKAGNLVYVYELVIENNGCKVIAYRTDFLTMDKEHTVFDAKAEFEGDFEAFKKRWIMIKLTGLITMFERSTEIKPYEE